MCNDHSGIMQRVITLKVWCKKVSYVKMNEIQVSIIILSEILVYIRNSFNEWNKTCIIEGRTCVFHVWFVVSIKFGGKKERIIIFRRPARLCV